MFLPENYYDQVKLRNGGKKSKWFVKIIRYVYI
uniref:Uncharacterized protein n=1 Tax=Rhizophora mucronata TaxID=61149 RepID=A0A2P2QR24_RHIMU